VRRRKVHAFARQPRGRLDQPRPRESAVLAPEQLEASGQTGHAARRRPDRVVNELGAERHVEMGQLCVALLRA
jgi:hypothetical protein